LFNAPFKGFEFGQPDAPLDQCVGAILVRRLKLGGKTLAV
jgi:hypothetical protein